MYPTLTRQSSKILGLLICFSPSLASCNKTLVGNDAKPAVVDRRILLEQVTTTLATNGAVSGAISAHSNTTQVLAAAGGTLIAGTSVAFPPGALAIDTTVSLVPASTLNNGSFNQMLGISATTVASSPAVSIQSGTATDAVVPFTLNLAIPSSVALNLLDDPYANLAVLYSINKVAEGGTFAGVFTRQDLQIINGKVRVTTKHFGTFQAIISAAPIPPVPEKAVTPAQIAKHRYYTRGIKVASFGTGADYKDRFQGWLLRLSDAKVTAPSTELTSGFILRLETN